MVLKAKPFTGKTLLFWVFPKLAIYISGTKAWWVTTKANLEWKGEVMNSEKFLIPQNRKSHWGPEVGAQQCGEDRGEQSF